MERAQTIANVREMNGMSDQSLSNIFHMPNYNRGNSYNGSVGNSKDDDTELRAAQLEKVLNNFPKLLQLDDMNAKEQRNGSSFPDFGEFNARDHYYNSSSNNSLSNSANNFPIGTFSIEQTTQQPNTASAAPQKFPTTE